MSEEVIILSPGDTRAQKIAKAISSGTANDILHLLGDGQQSATDITGTLDLPMSTVKYHLDNLLDAGLVEVVENKYSVKGREIKIYALRDQLLIVAPKMQNVRSLLLKYASLFAIVALASLAGFFYLPRSLPLFRELPGAESMTGVSRRERSRSGSCPDPLLPRRLFRRRLHRRPLSSTRPWPSSWAAAWSSCCWQSMKCTSGGR